MSELIWADRIDHEFGGQTLSNSLLTWLDTHPAIKRGALAALMLATALRTRS